MNLYVNKKAENRRWLKEAAAWVDRRSGKDWDDDQESAFQAWFHQSKSSQQAYHQVAATWNDAALSEALSEPKPVELRFKSKAVWGAVRTSMLMSCLVAIGYGAFFFKPKQQEVRIAWASVVAGNVHKIVILADDTQVHMNAGTKASVGYGPGQRTLNLENGEIFLNVTPDKQRPFEVRTAYGKILVTGTSFNVNTKRGRLEVAVRNGQVQVISPFGQQANLKHGQSVAIRNGKLGQVTPISLAAIDAWRHPWVETSGMSLSTLVEQLQSEHDLKIKIDNEALGQVSISGRFSTSNPKELLEDLGLAHDFTVKMNRDEIELHSQ